ncbi:MAG: 2-amino-4-hydroxy-6-hydroxymethyldihydropteridine diphosphokinase [Halomonadaceae bacterium T82-2]|nr:MAG: 2-amino-4-hydroxy-6-hydroxymethyldihydropteridine diphosphokinase [Halomonadaceae bacterium T82-2]
MTEQPRLAYVGLGSNLDDPEHQVRRALAELDALPLTRCEAGSPLYRSTPMGPQDQPPFINAVARLATHLSPLALLDQLQALEQRHRRVRRRHWGPRTLDLDLLLYGDCRGRWPRLTLPHPGITERNFVLVPLADIAPDTCIGDAAVSHLADAIDRDGLQRLVPQQ